MILRPRLTQAEVVAFPLIPTLAVTFAVAVAGARRVRPAGILGRVVVRQVLPFFPASIPLAALSAPSLVAGDMGTFVHGALFSAQSRFRVPSYQPPFPPSKLIWALPLL